MPAMKCSTRSSMRTGARVSDRPLSISMSRWRRKGRSGSSALQCGSGNVASATDSVRGPASARPLARAQAVATAESISTPAASSRTSRSKGVSSNASVMKSIGAVTVSAARASSTTRSRSSASGSD